MRYNTDNNASWVEVTSSATRAFETLGIKAEQVEFLHEVGFSFANRALLPQVNADAVESPWTVRDQYYAHPWIAAGLGGSALPMVSGAVQYGVRILPSMYEMALIPTLATSGYTLGVAAAGAHALGYAHLASAAEVAEEYGFTAAWTLLAGGVIVRSAYLETGRETWRNTAKTAMVGAVVGGAGALYAASYLDVTGRHLEAGLATSRVTLARISSEVVGRTFGLGADVSRAAGEVVGVAATASEFYKALDPTAHTKLLTFGEAVDASDLMVFKAGIKNLDKKMYANLMRATQDGSTIDVRTPVLFGLLGGKLAYKTRVRVVVDAPDGEGGVNAMVQIFMRPQERAGMWPVLDASLTDTYANTQFTALTAAKVVPDSWNADATSATGQARGTKRKADATSAAGQAKRTKNAARAGAWDDDM